MAEDQAVKDMELPAIAQSGRWKSPEVPARYVERMIAGRGAVATSGSKTEEVSGAAKVGLQQSYWTAKPSAACQINVTGSDNSALSFAYSCRRWLMADPDDREAGYYWISIGGQEPEVAQWQTEWCQWLVARRETPLSDVRAIDLVVLSGMLPPPALTAPAA